MFCIPIGFFVWVCFCLVVTGKKKKNQPENVHIFGIIDIYLAILYHNTDMEICWALDKPMGSMLYGAFLFWKAHYPCINHYYMMIII